MSLTREELLAQLSPFHVEVGEDGCVLSVGPSLSRLAPRLVGQPFAERFEFRRPVVEGPRALRRVATGQTIEIALRAPPSLLLRGQLLADGERTLFVGRPWVVGTEDLRRQGLSLNDFAAHEGVAETVLLVETHRRAVEHAKAYEAALTTAKERAEAHSRSKSLFLASMSHEIRNPLNVVVGMTDLLAECELAPETAQYVASLRSNARGLSSLLGDVIDIARIEEGAVDLEREPTGVVELADDVVDGWFPAAAAKGVELFVTAPVSLAPLPTDRARLRQILSNLVNNAIKFTDRGYVNVVVGATARGAEREAFVEVRDTGAGIPDAQLESIFARFERAHPELEGDAARHGTGLGLAITRTLVEALGGSITVTSEVGRGSCFRVAFPQASPGRSPVAQPLGLRVRVVERSGPARDALVGALHRLGVDRVRVGTGLTQSTAPADVTIVGETTRDGGVARPVIVFGPRSDEPGVTHAVTRLFGALSSTRALREALARVAPEAVPWSSSSAEPGTVESRSILVVDDDIDNREYLRALLTRDGHRVTTAEDGRLALKAWAQAGPDDRPDLIISDLHMPVMGGLDFARTLRSAGVPTPPLLAISGHAAEEHRAAALEAGFDCFLPKPIAAARLRSAIARWCGDHRPVLVVDDDPDSRLVLSRHLEKGFGRQVVQAGSGEEALEVARRESPGEVFVDLSLGNQCGWALIPLLREILGPEVLLFVCSGSDAPADERRAAAMACAGFLRKPVTRDAIAAALTSQGMLPPPEAPGTGSADALIPLRPDPLIADLVPPYLERARVELLEARRLADAGELERVSRIAHDLKGTGGAYGLEELSARARRIENAANAGDAELATALIERLGVYLSRVEVLAAE